MSTPTQQQAAAITAPIDKHVAVTAIPGSGKTYVIERRIKRYIDEGINPENILVITFSRTQAEDMSLRIFGTFPELVDTPLAAGLGGSSQVTTIHAACLRILKAHYNKSYEIAPEWLVRSLIEKWVEDNNWTYFNNFSGKDELVGRHSVKYWISKAKREYIYWLYSPLKDFYDREVGSEWSHNMAQCAVAVQQGLNRKNMWTFDDLLYEMETQLTGSRDFQQTWHDRFTHIMIDEAQDANPQAMRIVKLLNPESLFIVGDEDQSIFSFLGATPKVNLREGYDVNFGGMRLNITQNFRSYPLLLSRAEKLITYNYDEETQQHFKNLNPREGLEPGADLTWDWFEDAEEESLHVVGEISTQIASGEAKGGDFFIMARTNAQMAYYELELLQRGIPFVNLGTSSFFNRRVPRIIIDYMRLAVDPNCWDAYSYIYNIPSKFMSDRKGKYLQTRYLGRAFNDFLDRNGEVIEEVRRNKYKNNKKGWSQWKNGAEDLIQVVDKLAKYSESDSALAFVQAVREELLDRWMEDEYPVEQDMSESAYDDLGVMLEMAERFTIEELLAYIEQLQSTQKVKPEDLVDFVLIGTIYRFKGLERPNVYVVGMSEGLLPHRFSLGATIPTDGVPLPRTSTVWDERNLAYVAITRAKDRCHLSGIERWPTLKDDLNPSRFIQEMELI